MEVTIESMVSRWSGLERPLFKGKLIDTDGCKCAQGDVLSCAGFSDDDLRRMEQSKADVETARVLGISRTHSVLLRSVNDKAGGAPQIVLSNPEQVIGDKAPLLLAFWLHLDSLSAAARAAARDAARAAPGDAAWAAAWDAAWDAAAQAAAGAAAWDAAEDAAAQAAAWAAAGASSEIQGMDILERDGKQPYFLAFFGFDTWDAVRALNPTRNWRCLERKRPKMESDAEFVSRWVAENSQRVEGEIFGGVYLDKYGAQRLLDALRDKRAKKEEAAP